MSECVRACGRAGERARDNALSKLLDDTSLAGMNVGEERRGMCGMNAAHVVFLDYCAIHCVDCGENGLGWVGLGLVWFGVVWCAAAATQL